MYRPGQTQQHRQQQQRPVESETDTETETETETETSSGSTTDSDVANNVNGGIRLPPPRTQGQIHAEDLWNRQQQLDQLRARRSGNPEPRVGAEAGASHVLGVRNTQFRYAERRQTAVLMLDSLDRDFQAFPLPTQMVLHLPRRYRNVERLDIVQLRFFNGLYPFSAARGNTTLYIGATAVTIPDGNYTIAQLVAALNTALSTPVATGVTAAFNANTGKITLSSGAPFALNFQTGLLPTQASANSGWGLGWNLGFGGPAANSTGSASYTASCVPRIYDEYIYLQLNVPEHMNMVDHTSPENAAISQESTGQTAHYFGKLLLNNFGCWCQTFVEMPKIFRPVLGRLDRLTITWVDRYGQPFPAPPLDSGAASCDWHMTVRIVEIAEGPSATSALMMAGGLRSAGSESDEN
jgi:hypothetical protein